MPNTPQFRFNVKNNNVEVSTPGIGVTHVLARTTKGAFNDPSRIINSYPQFQRYFGEEIVPDGSVSNIRKALENGSRLRISRVEGSAGATDAQATVTIDFLDSQGVKVFTANLSAKCISGLEGNIIVLSSDYELRIGVGASSDDLLASVTFSLNRFHTTKDLLADLINQAFNYQDDNFIITFTSSVDGTSDGEVETINASTSDEAAGSNGGNNVSVANYTKAFKAFGQYKEAYQVIASHIHQYTFAGQTENYLAVYKAIADKLKGYYNSVLYVEVPKSFTTPAAIAAQANTMLETIGYSGTVAIFAGGLKYRDEYGITRDCDVLGTVVALGDVSASLYGPQYSFAGLNRGVVPDALGIVMDPLGDNEDDLADLQTLAEAHVNLFTIQGTPTNGRAVVLWHNFTANDSSSSERFLSTMRMLIYLKKNIQPIFRSYIEEPNYWITWTRIKNQCMPVFDPLIGNAIDGVPVWNGDQDVSSFDDLQVNTEAEVRQGKYKVEVHMRDLVTLQDITLTINMDQAAKSVSITTQA